MRNYYLRDPWQRSNEVAQYHDANGSVDRELTSITHPFL